MRGWIRVAWGVSLPTSDQALTGRCRKSEDFQSHDGGLPFACHCLAGAYNRRMASANFPRLGVEALDDIRSPLGLSYKELGALFHVGERSVLEVLATSGVEPVYAYLERPFSNTPG